jgi:hypothetical protein
LYGANINNWVFNSSPTPQYPVSVINAIAVYPTGTWPVGSSSAGSAGVYPTATFAVIISNWTFSSSPTPQYPVSITNWQPTPNLTPAQAYNDWIQNWTFSSSPTPQYPVSIINQNPVPTTYIVTGSVISLPNTSPTPTPNATPGSISSQLDWIAGPVSLAQNYMGLSSFTEAPTAFSSGYTSLIGASSGKTIYIYQWDLVSNGAATLFFSNSASAQLSESGVALYGEQTGPAGGYCFKGVSGGDLGINCSAACTLSLHLQYLQQ